MATIYVQKRVEGLNKLLLYLTGEKVSYEKHYAVQPFPWIEKIVITGELGEWNLRTVWDILNSNDLRVKYSNNRLEIFV